MKGTHHIGMVGKGYCRHILLCRGSHQVFDIYCGLQYRKLGMVVQMDKRGICQCLEIFLDFFTGNFNFIVEPQPIRNFLGSFFKVDMF